MSRQCTHYGRWPQHGFTSLKKLRPQLVTSRIQPGSDVIVCAEMDEQWGYVGAKSRQRRLFYEYDRIRRTVVAHVFGERSLARYADWLKDFKQDVARKSVSSGKLANSVTVFFNGVAQLLTFHLDRKSVV